MADDFREENWEQVDADPESEQYVDFLSNISDHEWLNEAKVQSYRMIRPDEGDEILDVGCGIGDDVRGLAEFVGSDGRVVGVDNSETMIDEARERHRSADDDRLEFAVADAHRLDLPDDEFDSARTERVLQHVDEPKSVVREMTRVTRPGGLVWIADPDWSTYVIDAPDQSLSDRLVDPQWAPARNPSVGRKLYRFFDDVGYAEFEVGSHSVVLRDADRAIETLRLESRLQRMESEGEVSASRTADYLSELRAASDAGEFLAAGTAFWVVGRVPAES